MNGAATYLYVGCYTNRSPVGIRAFVVGQRSSPPAPIDEVTEIPQASFLARHPSGRVLYAVSETDAGPGGEVAALAIAPDGRLTCRARVPSHGDHPCHVSVDAGGHHLHVANYSSGTMAVYALDADGTPHDLVGILESHGSGPSPRQQGPHTHAVVPDPTGRWLYTTDLGADRIVQSVAATPVAEHVMTPGSGPRHLCFHPRLPLMFVVGELDNTLTMLAFDSADGSLSPLVSRSTLPPGWDGPSLAADLHVRSRFVHVSNRGHDSIASFEIDEVTASLQPLGWTAAGGRTPRGFAIDPTASLMVVAHQDDDTMATFGLHAERGVPVPVGGGLLHLSEPVCARFVEQQR